MTREEIINQMAKVRAKRHYIQNLTRAGVKLTAQEFSDSDWDSIIVGVRDNKTALIGDTIRNAVLKVAFERSRDDVLEKLVGDDALTMTELEDLL